MIFILIGISIILFGLSFWLWWLIRTRVVVVEVETKPNTTQQVSIQSGRKPNSKIFLQMAEDDFLLSSSEDEKPT